MNEHVTAERSNTHQGPGHAWQTAAEKQRSGTFRRTQRTPPKQNKQAEIARQGLKLNVASVYQMGTSEVHEQAVTRHEGQQEPATRVGFTPSAHVGMSCHVMPRQQSNVRTSVRQRRTGERRHATETQVERVAHARAAQHMDSRTHNQGGDNIATTETTHLGGAGLNVGGGAVDAVRAARVLLVQGVLLRGTTN